MPICRALLNPIALCSFEFVPRLVFMLSTFGYMIFLIVYKFTVDWPNRPDLDPPNLVQVRLACLVFPPFFRFSADLLLLL